MKIHLHGAGNEAAETVEVDAEKALGVLVSERATTWGEVVSIAVQDADDDLDISMTIQEARLTEGHRLHLARCERVTVAVEYNGATKSHAFRPNKRIKSVKEWAVSAKAFNIAPRDAADLVLAYGNPLQKVSEGLHIGDLRFSDCRLTLSLVPINFFQG